MTKSTIRTELLPSTNPLPGGGGNMLRFVTDGILFNTVHRSSAGRAD